ncbi:DeoR/GlpR family DNA-binding transcription regulator [Streptomyces sp. NPDC050433]|uniref:DeoR/GlpR family DNA-binding transcription regulator n=1 Tax=unclassified Streptomyces TaxID=2593676 RepID=UPI0034302309
MASQREKRLQRILELLEEHGKVETAPLAQELGVTELTVRRDIDHLSGQGIARRVYGGLELNAGRSFEPPFSMRIRKNVERKKAMARAAVDLVKRGENIALDFGTKAYFVALEMRERHLQALVGVTSVQVMEVLGQDSDIHVLIPGGELRPQELNFYGSTTQRFFREHRWDTAIVSVAGVSVESDLVSDYNETDAQLKAAMLSSADQVVLLVEERHLGAVSFSPVGSLSRITTIVTDAPRANPVVESLESHGVTVVHAEHTPK